MSSFGASAQRPLANLVLQEYVHWIPGCSSDGLGPLGLRTRDVIGPLGLAVVCIPWVHGDVRGSRWHGLVVDFSGLGLLGPTRRIGKRFRPWVFGVLLALLLALGRFRFLPWAIGVLLALVSKCDFALAVRVRGARRWHVVAGAPPRCDMLPSVRNAIATEILDVLVPRHGFCAWARMLGSCALDLASGNMPCEAILVRCSIRAPLEGEGAVGLRKWALVPPRVRKDGPMRPLVCVQELVIAAAALRFKAQGLHFASLDSHGRLFAMRCTSMLPRRLAIESPPAGGAVPLSVHAAHCVVATATWLVALREN